MLSFKSILENMQLLHDKKARDYTDTNSNFSNFQFAAELSSKFHDPVSKVYATMVGIKLARIISLQNRPPANEAVADTWIDLCNYIVLWTEYELGKDR